MRLDAEDIADIQEAIRDEGMPCQWQTVEETPIDPNKPWLGNELVPTLNPVDIAFVDVATAGALLTQWGKDTDVGSSSLFGLMPHVSFTPEIGQLVKRAGREDLTVKDVTAAEPAGVAVFYLLEFSA